VSSSELTGIGSFFEALCDSEDLSERIRVDGGATGAFAAAARGVNAFLDKMWLREFQLAAKREMLEKVVEIRTNEVHEILDNVKSGFLMADEDELVQDNYSRSCHDIFGREGLVGQPLSELMQLSERERGNFSVMYGQIFDSILPLQVSASQLPSRFRIGERHFHLEGVPIVSDGEVRKVFFTVTDATDLHAAESENALRLALLEILKQRDGFAQFLDEFRRMVDHSAKTSDPSVVRAYLHTTKGNLGCFGLHELASLVHSLEELQEFEYAQMLSVESALRRFLESHREVLGIDYDDVADAPSSVEVARIRGSLDRIVEAETVTDRRELARDLLTRARWVPCEKVLAGIPGLVDRVSARLGKQVRVEFAGGETPIDPRWTGEALSTLVHIVRNSIDHGIELAGTVRVACADTGDGWTIAISDDGRGIDVDKVVKAAVAKGFTTAEAAAAMSQAEQVRLIFVDGLTTCHETSMISGRGVGTGAVAASVEALGGRVSVDTGAGRGTTVTVRIPHPPLTASVAQAGQGRPLTPA